MLNIADYPSVLPQNEYVSKFFGILYNTWIIGLGYGEETTACQEALRGLTDELVDLHARLSGQLEKDFKLLVSDKLIKPIDASRYIE